MTRKHPRKTLRPRSQKVRLRVSPKLTEQEIKHLKASAKADLRSIADYVVQLIEKDLRKRTGTNPRRIRGAGPDDRRKAYEIGMTLTVEQRKLIEAKAEREVYRQLDVGSEQLGPSKNASKHARAISYHVLRMAET